MIFSRQWLKSFVWNFEHDFLSYSDACGHCQTGIWTNYKKKNDDVENDALADLNTMSNNDFDFDNLNTQEVDSDTSFTSDEDEECFETLILCMTILMMFKTF